jgi:hypothetical protein
MSQNGTHEGKASLDLWRLLSYLPHGRYRSGRYLRSRYLKEVTLDFLRDDAFKMRSIRSAADKNEIDKPAIADLIRSTGELPPGSNFASRVVT